MYLHNKTEIGLQMQKSNLQLLEISGGGTNWDVGIDIYTMEYYSTIKKNAFESVLMRWMKLEPIIKSQVSQKEKQVHIYEFRKMVTITLCTRQQKRH